MHNKVNEIASSFKSIIIEDENWYEYNQQENLELKEGITLNEFLQSKQLSREGVAVAVDEKIVKKADFDTFVLKDGMSVDVFNMVSGG